MRTKKRTDFPKQLRDGDQFVSSSGATGIIRGPKGKKRRFLCIECEKNFGHDEVAFRAHFKDSPACKARLKKITRAINKTVVDVFALVYTAREQGGWMFPGVEGDHRWTYAELQQAEIKITERGPQH